MNLHAFLTFRAASARSLNATKFAANLPIGDYIDDRDSFRAKLITLKNIGRRSLDEITSLIEEAIAEASAPPSASVEAAAKGASELHAETPSLETMIADLFVAKLADRAREVICMRGAIGIDHASTLEEIGELYGVTRERIRQIEKNAKRVMSAWLSPFEEAIVDDWLTFFKSRSAPFTTSKEDVRALWGDLPPHLQAALFCLDLDQAEILNRIYCPYGSGWLLSGEVRETTERLDELLCEYQEGAVLVPVAHLARKLGIPVAMVSAILHIHERYQEYRAYVLRRPSYQRARRTVILHHLLSGSRAGGPLLLPRILSEYRANEQHIPCSSRDALVVMAEQVTKNMFLNCYEYGWFALPPYPDAEPLGATPAERVGSIPLWAASAAGSGESSEEPVSGADYTEEAASIERRIEQILSSGPRAFEDIRDVFDSGTHSAARGSIGPIIIGSEKFLRVAPGVYALLANAYDPDSISKGEALLLSDKHCRLYCQARWAGEPAALYPYWGGAMELRWATLLSDQGSSILFGSLMAIASVHEWPISSGRREYWRGRQVSSSKYLLEEPPGIISERAYTSRQVVAAAVQSVTEGRTSWMACNRAAGKRIDDRHACSLLATLIRLGVIDGAQHWQREHKVTKCAPGTVERMLELLGKQPDISLRELHVGLTDVLPSPGPDGTWLDDAKEGEFFMAAPDSSAEEGASEPHFGGASTDMSSQILSVIRRRKI